MYSYLVRVTSRIRALARSGQIANARKLFDEMPHKDSIAWNAMLSSYSQVGQYQEALSLFHQMRIANAKLDAFSFTGVLSSCSGSAKLSYGEKVHALVVTLGYGSCLSVSNSLIDMYGKCLRPCSADRLFQEMDLQNEVSWCSLLFAFTSTGQFDVALGVFHAMPKRVLVSWNTLIAGHARCGESGLCLDLFKKMLEEDSCSPDQWTFSALMNASAESQEFHIGCMVHAFIVKSGWSSAAEANNSILSFYARLSCEDATAKILESNTTLNEVSWNTMIDAYMKIGETHEAFLVFLRAPEKNVISWTSMISGYVRNGHGEQAIGFFIDMIRNGLQPDDVMFGAILHACSNLATLGHGRMVHGCVLHSGFVTCVYVSNSLVNMYAKCGDIESSTQVFIDIHDKDLISWNTMLFAFGLHGWAVRALRLHDEMVTLGVKPDRVTFLGLLMACSHSGLVEEGQSLFESMISVYGLTPELDHVACVVDMLGRGGYLKEARDFISKYVGTHKIRVSSSEALFGACSAQGEVEIGSNIGRHLKILEPKNEMSYVLLSNLYCASGHWKEAEMVRKAMADQGVKKLPGCSWIEVRNEVIAFVSGKHSFPYMEGLSSVLYLLEHEMKVNPCLVVCGRRIT